MAKRHNFRKYSNHRHEVIRPMDEYFKVEIMGYDPNDTITYSLYDYDYENTENAEETQLYAWRCLKSKNEAQYFVDVRYDVTKFDEYRFDIMYQLVAMDIGSTGKIEVINSNGDVIKQDTFNCDGDINNPKRKSLFMELAVDTYTIRYTLPNNVYTLGIIARRTMYWTGDSLDSAGTNLMLLSASVSKGGKAKLAEASIVIGFDDNLECWDSPSGFYIDYKNELNMYCREEDGTLIQIFGGYVSSIQQNNSGTQLTISGTCRLSDGSKKYILESMVLKGGTSDEASYVNDMFRDFETYGAALQHLCEVVEETLNNNVNENYLVDGENYNETLTTTYGNKGTVQTMRPKDMSEEVYDNFIMLRNNSANGQQWAYLFDCTENHIDPVDITDYPNLYITYGLGDPKTEEGSESADVDRTGITGTIQQIADGCTKGITGALEKAKSIHEWLRVNVRYSKYPCSHYSTAEACLAHKTAINCADTSRLTSALMRAAGLNAYVVHAPNHFYTIIEINGAKYISDQTGNGSAWNTYWTACCGRKTNSDLKGGNYYRVNGNEPDC